MSTIHGNSDLSDIELMDIRIARGELDYVARLALSADPRFTL
jgi:hypothetical protein